MPTATAQAVLSFPARRGRELTLASRTPHDSRRTLMTLKTITARACYSWAAFVRDPVHPPASIHAERRWMYANSDVAWLTGAAICPIGSPWAVLRLRTVCSRADAGAIRTTATPRSMLRQPPVASAVCTSLSTRNGIPKKPTAFSKIWRWARYIDAPSACSWPQLAELLLAGGQGRGGAGLRHAGGGGCAGTCAAIRARGCR